MTKLVEHLHLARALSWIPITAAVFIVGWQDAVWVVFLYSAYANLESGLATWQSRRAERRSLEHP